MTSLCSHIFSTIYKVKLSIHHSLQSYMLQSDFVHSNNIWLGSIPYSVIQKKHAWLCMSYSLKVRKMQLFCVCVWMNHVDDVVFLLKLKINKLFTQS